MADVELLYFDHLGGRPEPKGASVILNGITEEGGPWSHHEASAPWTETRRAACTESRSATWTETRLEDKPQRGSELWMETRLEDKPQRGSELWMETRLEDKPQRGSELWTETRLEDKPQRGSELWMETRLEDNLQRGSAPWTETRLEDKPQKCSASWAETKLEDKPQRGSAPWAETKLEDKPQRGSASWTETRLEDQSEIFFSCKHQAEEDLHLQTCIVSHSFSSSLYEEDGMEEQEDDIPELYLLSDEDLSSDGSGKSVDYGFIIAVSCLVTGISLVAISYTVPRDVQVDRDSVSAREIERLEWDKAQLGAHLDRCVIAGLCLLTLGGVLLSTLLMISMWKGEMIRRKAFAYSKQAASLYGSISLRRSSSPAPESSSHVSEADEDLEVLG